MATSEFKSYIRTAPALVCDKNRPLDSYTSRVTASNINHLSDEFAQVRVTWSSNPQETKAYLGPVRAINGLASLVSGFLFPISVRQNGDSYKFRIRVAAKIGGGKTGRVWMAIVPPSSTPGFGSSRIETVAQDNVWRSNTFTSATTAWLTGASRGPEAWSDLITLPGGGYYTVSYPTKTELGGDDASVIIPNLQLLVWSSTSDVSELVQIQAVYCAEVIGIDS